MNGYTLQDWINMMQVDENLPLGTIEMRNPETRELIKRVVNIGIDDDQKENQSSNSGMQ